MIRERLLFEILDEVEKLLRRHLPDRRRGALVLIGQGKVETMSFNIKTGQSMVATALFTDDKDVARPLASGTVPAWSVIPADALALTPAADGMTCGIVGGPNPEDFVLTVTGQGDPDAAVDPLTGNISGTVTAPEDSKVTITVA